MSLIACRDKFQAGQISKENYIETMCSFHSYLFEYTEFIKNTDIANIEIYEDRLIFTLKNLDIKLQCHVLDKRITPIEILNFNSYEKQDADILFSLFEENMVFFDIGAHIGFYSISAAKCNETIKVYSFEPVPQTFELLKNNISINKLNNISLFNIGLLDFNNEIDFFLNPSLSGNASAKNVAESINIKKISVKVTSLDNFLFERQLSNIDIIKCDVEGGELLVFQGGIKSIHKYKPIIFTEMLRKWSKKFHYHPNDIIKLLASLEYQCFFSQNEKLVEFFTMNEDTVATNFFFLHREKHQEYIQRLSW
jgi:FkbM family methyltransferase